MKYLTGTEDKKNIFVFLRNKNLAVFPQKVNLFDWFLNRSASIIECLRLRRLRSRGFKLIVSEQIIENALVLRNLQDNERNILDFGGFESILPLQLSTLGFKVTVWDQRPYPFKHPNLDTICLDLFRIGVTLRKKYDEIISISTIEHLGLGHYGDEEQPDADIRGVEILWQMLSAHGRLIASVPVGAKYSVQRGYRIYDEERLLKLFPHAISINFYAKNGREGAWSLIRPDAVKKISYEEVCSQMPVEAIAFVICDKNKPSLSGRH